MRILAVTTLAAAMTLAGCTTNPQTGQQEFSKTAIGALAGAALGAGISKASGGDHTGRDAAIGAALGAGVGLYMDKQEQQLREQMAGTGVEVSRNEQTGAVDLVMPGNITFAFDSSNISPNFTGTLNQVASTMKEFDKSTITVKGYTDNVGSAAYNQGLSQRRANAVAGYLVNSGVAAHRINAVGYGMSNPVASNNTDAGRAQNRRVEISINAPQSVQ